MKNIYKSHLFFAAGAFFVKRSSPNHEQYEKFPQQHENRAKVVINTLPLAPFAPLEIQTYYEQYKNI